MGEGNDYSEAIFNKLREVRDLNDGRSSVQDQSAVKGLVQFYFYSSLMLFRRKTTARRL